jgi:hypothetical protein
MYFGPRHCYPTCFTIQKSIQGLVGHIGRIFKEERPLLFTSTKNGWTNNIYGIEWLKTVFKPYTRPKRAITKRLLIVNSYLSYVNLTFIKYVSRYNIIILILPSYLTY